MTTLIENNVFLKTNLKNLMAQKPTITRNEADDTDVPKINNNSKKLRRDLNWKQELEDRIKANRALTDDIKKPESEIIKGFWSDCFTTLWPADIQKYLDELGPLFKKDLLTWGFTKNRNPMVAFINQGYVQTNLIKTKKLNSNTYKAFHNAIIKKLNDFEEYLKFNNYNIIYCLDLYEKLPADIYKYLELQKNILAERTSNAQLNNRRVFLEISTKTLGIQDIDKRAQAQANMQEDKIPKDITKAKLNKYDLAISICNLLGVEAEEEKKISEVEFADDSISYLLDVVDRDPAKVHALLTHLYATTGNSNIVNFIEKHSSAFKQADVSSLPATFFRILQKTLGKKTLSAEAIDKLLFGINKNLFR